MEVALKTRVPLYGYAHEQLGLETWPELQEVGWQLFGGVEYDGPLFGWETVQYLLSLSQIGLSTSLQIIKDN